MKIASLISRLLLGLLFLVFGLNGFLHFIAMPLPDGVAGQYMMALAASGYLSVVFLLEVLAAVLLLLNRYVPLALVLLAPILFNIFLFHALMAPAGLPLALIAIALWLLTAVPIRSAFGVLLQRKVEAPASRLNPSINKFQTSL